MNVPTLEMDPVAADEKYAAFTISRRRDPETLAATKIYRLLAAGKKLVDVGVAIRTAPVDEKGRPRLAIAPAHRRQIHFEWRPYRDVCRFDGNNRRGRQWSQFVFEVNMNRRHGQTYRTRDGVENERWLDGYALVPMVPATVSLCGYAPRDLHILWEVEAWADSPLIAEPDRDPYLLRRVSGDLFEVLGEWDLTDVERYVMAGRARVTQ